ncbi:S1 family peptidase [Saccharicrinis fermentans]|uniref:Serine protease n=1 Tax=Saccharicrinis fermentans DSM 9555 = JCM 21142 TaxID=869213 RepID=W7Y5X2_9BACT|nr:serine protease [Saccharicrinis fermentans]GAF03542.1 putative periplasmic serine endoprotease DegP-like precursor [Saccharicrinis fermentans DSM 9555 = JCM 21142]
MKFYVEKIICVGFVLALLCSFIYSQGINSDLSQVEEEPIAPVSQLVDDLKIQSFFYEKAEELYHGGNCVPFSVLNEQISNVRCKIELDKLQSNRETLSYESQRKGTLIIGKLCKCATCPNIHLMTASAFVISKDGLCVTNHHVFSPSSMDKNSYMAVFVMDIEGNVFPVEEVMAANKENDVAIFRVNTSETKLTPLSLGSDIKTGEEVSVVSHPQRQFYTYTKGYVTRHFESHDAPRFSISAEFAVGSSGAPIFNSEGKVVGVVSATRANYDSSGKSLQMVVKIAIPIEGVKKLYANECF